PASFGYTEMVARQLILFFPFQTSSILPLVMHR
ncbi:MAG: hypothetical protein ACI9J0_003339, partial [Cryomorphaceae bacterium]